MSSIYEWFQADFGDSEAGVVSHLGQYAGAQLRARLAGRNGYDGDHHDWTLSDVR